jgi:hypothetical protein
MLLDCGANQRHGGVRVEGRELDFQHAWGEQHAAADDVLSRH